MTVYNVVNERGTGKTSFATSYALKYSEKYPNNMIYANYHLKLKNFEYTPYMVLPFSKMKDCLIIADDFYALECQKGFTKVISNFSRKTDIDIIITVQYYTAIPPNIRTQSILTLVNIDKENEILYITFIKRKYNPFNLSEFETLVSYHYEKDIFKKIGKIYDTKEIVKFSSERKVCQEILRISKTNDDIYDNIELYADTMTKRNRYVKIMKELNPTLVIK